MERSTFWTGYLVYVIIQVIIIVARLAKFIEISWWLVFIPSFIIFFGGLAFMIYFILTCNPRIEKENGEK